MQSGGPCEVDPFGAEVCLPVEDFLITWSGRNRKAQKYFKRLERKIDGWDFKRVRRNADLKLTRAMSRSEIEGEWIEAFQDMDCCMQYGASQRQSFVDMAGELGVLVMRDIENVPGFSEP